jgi:hypothetical protein
MMQSSPVSSQKSVLINPFEGVNIADDRNVAPAPQRAVGQAFEGLNIKPPSSGKLPARHAPKEFPHHAFSCAQWDVYTAPKHDASNIAHPSEVAGYTVVNHRDAAPDITSKFYAVESGQYGQHINLCRT